VSGAPAAGRKPAILAAALAAPVLAAAVSTVLLGLDGAAGVFAVDLSSLAEHAAVQLVGATDAVDVRALFPVLDRQQAAALGYARGILRWNREQRHCGACGQPTVSGAGGTQRRCSAPAAEGYCSRGSSPPSSPWSRGPVSRLAACWPATVAPPGTRTPRWQDSSRSASAWRMRSAGRSPKRPACGWARGPMGIPGVAV